MKKAFFQLCNFSGETTNTTKEFSLVVFFSVMAYQSLPCVKGGGLRSKTEGLLKAKNYSKTIPQSPSVTAPFTQGSLWYAPPLRIVGSGFCPIMSQRERREGARRVPPFGGGHPRAMLAPDASVGKAENGANRGYPRNSTNLTIG